MKPKNKVDKISIFLEAMQGRAMTARELSRELVARGYQYSRQQVSLFLYYNMRDQYVRLMPSGHKEPRKYAPLEA